MSAILAKNSPDEISSHHSVLENTSSKPTNPKKAAEMDPHPLPSIHFSPRLEHAQEFMFWDFVATGE
jgi:hypothetical protein